ncbi:hypothetical protein GCM10023210_21160 [Chryseobacterium ginsengisoli]|uniref:Lipoprotein n=1 Tax=Chryseobacterium ginsengisoli TaxID=363853 RepID=A0ABP9MD68_9FLAO
MKKIIGIFLLLIFFSCEKGKTEFIQSKAIPSLFLIKNFPEEDSLLKRDIKLFLIKNSYLYNYKQNNNYNNIEFYKYTLDMGYFIENEEYDGFGAKVLSTHNDDLLGAFIISKCEKDSTKLVGELFYYGLKGSDDGQKEIDTLIYKCK